MLKKNLYANITIHLGNIQLSKIPHDTLYTFTIIKKNFLSFSYYDCDFYH